MIDERAIWEGGEGNYIQVVSCWPRKRRAGERGSEESGRVREWSKCVSESGAERSGVEERRISEKAEK